MPPTLRDGSRPGKGRLQRLRADLISKPLTPGSPGLVLPGGAVCQLPPLAMVALTLELAVKVGDTRQVRTAIEAFEELGWRISPGRRATP